MPEPALHVSCDAILGSLHLSINESITAPWTVLFGPSGSGKSSLLRILAGLWSPPGSRVSYRQDNLTKLPAYRRSIGLVAQHSALFPHMTVRQNLNFAGSARNAEWIAELTETFGLISLLDKFPSQLSGGEHQRAGIARSLGTKPRVLLLDEVFSGMHQAQQDKLIATLSRFRARMDMTILSVTHDVAEAYSCAEEILRIEEGRIIARGTPHTVLTMERATLMKRLSEQTESF